MTDWRCQKCHRLLMKLDLRDGTVEVKCPSCNTMNTVGYVRAIGKTAHLV